MIKAVTDDRIFECNKGHGGRSQYTKGILSMLISAKANRRKNNDKSNYAWV